jgi:Tol biopolymer transport system component
MPCSFSHNKRIISRITKRGKTAFPTGLKPDVPCREIYGGVESRQFYIADADGRNLIKLTEDFRIANLPSWSSDGQKLLYFKGVGTMCVGNASGGDAQCLETAQTVFAVWLPDSMHIAYVPGDLLSRQPKVCIVPVENLMARECVDAPGVAYFSLRP